MDNNFDLPKIAVPETRKRRMLSNLEVIKLHGWMEKNREMCETSHPDSCAKTCMAETDLKDIKGTNIKGLMDQLGWIAKEEATLGEVSRGEFLELRRVVTVIAKRILKSSSTTDEDRAILTLFTEKGE
jgi:hypothetical protein